MKARYYTFGIALIALLFLAGMSGCAGPVKVTGGGTMPSAIDGESGLNANFGFNGMGCPGIGYNWNITGHFNYLDKYAEISYDECSGGVKLNGEVIDAAACDGSLYVPSFCYDCTGFVGDEPYYAVIFSYASTNPKCGHRETGEGFACVKDNGEGANAEPDEACIEITEGPYAGYTNCGEVQGNIKARPCDIEECY